ncbi:MAG: hypothetical protein AAGG68_20970 [Bacteroidota bacterium]
MAFHSGNVELAKKRLKQIQVKPQEREQVKALQFSIVQQEVLSAFERYDFEGVLNSRADQFNQQVLAANKLLDDQVNVAIGIAHLYLGQYEKAEAVLKVCTQANHLQTFNFYYLLAILYQQKINDYAAFQQAHQYLYELLDQNRIDYLKVAFHLSQGKFDVALKLLEKLEHGSRSSLMNINALKAILGDGQTEDHTKIKPLYKALLQKSMSPTEKTYLTHFGELARLLDEVDEAVLQTQTTADYKATFAQNKTLSKVEFEKLLYQKETSEYPFLVYNQVATLYNETDYTEALGTAIRHEKYFFQIPESISLYLSIAERNSNVRIVSIFRTAAQHLEQRKNQFNTAQIDSVGWLLLNLLLKAEHSDRSKLDKGCVSLLKAIPDLTAIKFWLICRYAISQEKSLLRKNRLAAEAENIFDAPNLKANKEALIFELTRILNEFYGITQSPFSFLRLESDKSFLKLLTSFIEVFNRAVASEHFNTATKTALEVYKLLNEYLGKAVGVYEQLELQPLYDTFKPAYETLIEKFRENYPASPYYRDFQSIELAPRIATLKSLFEEDDALAFIDELKVLHQAGQIELGFKVLLDCIDEKHYEPEDAFFLASFLLYLPEIDSERFDDWLATLFNGYKERSSNRVYNRHHTFHGNVLKEMLDLKSPVTYPTMQDYLGHFGDDMLQFGEPVIYNSIAAFLDYAAKLQKNKSDVFIDHALMKKLLNYIGKMAKQRGLKGLTNKHKKLSKAFA